MFEKAKPRRDAFTFSLGGMNTVSSFVVSPAIADDRINRIVDEQRRHTQEDQPNAAWEIGVSWGRFWLRRRRQAV